MLHHIDLNTRWHMRLNNQHHLAVKNLKIWLFPEKIFPTVTHYLTFWNAYKSKCWRQPTLNTEPSVWLFSRRQRAFISPPENEQLDLFVLWRQFVWQETHYGLIAVLEVYVKCSSSDSTSARLFEHYVRCSNSTDVQIDTCKCCTRARGRHTKRTRPKLWTLTT